MKDHGEIVTRTRFGQSRFVAIAECQCCGRVGRAADVTAAMASAKAVTAVVKGVIDERDNATATGD